MQVWMSHDSGTISRQCERHLEHSDIPNKATICPNKGNKNSIKAGAGQSDTASLCATNLRERNSSRWLYSAIYSSSLHWKGRTELHHSTLTGYLHHQGKPSIYLYARSLPCIHTNLESVSLSCAGTTWWRNCWFAAIWCIGTEERLERRRYIWTNRLYLNEDIKCKLPLFLFQRIGNCCQTLASGCMC